MAEKHSWHSAIQPIVGSTYRALFVCLMTTPHHSPHSTKRKHCPLERRIVIKHNICIYIYILLSALSYTSLFSDIMENENASIVQFKCSFFLIVHKFVFYSNGAPCNNNGG